MEPHSTCGMGTDGVSCDLLQPADWLSRTSKERCSVTMVPFLVSVAFFLIAEIDSPRTGVIRVLPQNLISLSQSLHKQ